MGLLLITLFFAGYWFRRMLYSTRYTALRTESYHILFKSLATGGVLFVIAGGILWCFWDRRLLDSMTMNLVYFIWGNGELASETLRHYFGMLGLTVGLAVFLPSLLMNRVLWLWGLFREEAKQTKHLINRLEDSSPYKRFGYKILYFFFCTKSGGVWMDAVLRGDATETALLRSSHNRDLVELVMENRSYIGFVAESAAETGNMLGVELIPVARTYLSPKTGKLHICIYEEAENLENKERHKEKDKRILFQLSSIKFVRYIRCETNEDIKNYLGEKLLRVPSSTVRDYDVPEP